MINFYTNRELAQKFGLNLAKWKRWSREFLPPDPLGGLQSGFARQYTLKDAFRVYLAGFLVSELKYSIPAAKEIIDELTGWLESEEFLTNHDLFLRSAKNAAVPIERYKVIISQKKSAKAASRGGFDYQIRGIISDTSELYEGLPIRVERYVETRIHALDDSAAPANARSSQTLKLTDIIEYFMTSLNTPLPATDQSIPEG
ncbi:MAG: hypothetical protein H8E81_01805 [Deltaproteobacteria bacterium]|nr:hypothetical protein [Deltaproteobacteria bacterium]